MKWLAPFAFSFGAGNTVIDGWFTCVTELPFITSGSSFSLSNPGAPFSHK